MSADGVDGAARPDEVSIGFEVSTDNNRYEVQEVIWESSPREHDAAVLRIEGRPIGNVEPLQFSMSLPLLDDDEPARVYIIGHPKGGELSFSFEDNRLLDYKVSIVEDEQNASPCRIHYRTPTSNGSSGSPVFLKIGEFLASTIVVEKICHA